MKKSTQINGNLITEYRENAGLTQAKFAEKFNEYLRAKNIENTDYSNKTISAWENGNREPKDIQTSKALAEFIGVSMDVLCGAENIECTVACDNSENIANEKESKTYFNFNYEDFKEHLNLDMSGFFFGEEVCVNPDKWRQEREFWVIVPYDPSDYQIIATIIYDKEMIDIANDGGIIEKANVDEFLVDVLFENIKEGNIDRISDVESFISAVSTKNDFLLFCLGVEFDACFKILGVENCADIYFDVLEGYITEFGTIQRIRGYANLPENLYEIFYTACISKFGISKSKSIHEASCAHIDA